MGLLPWIDLTLCFLLFVLFVYVFASVTITNLHKAYLVFHFSMMLWPYCQFAIKTTDNPQFQLFYVKIAFLDTSLLAIGWLLFTVFLTGHTSFLRRKSSLLLFLPALLVAFAVILNPHGWFVQPVFGSYIQRTYGPLFWFNITILISYVVVSLYLLYIALVSNRAPRIKKQIKRVLQGITVMTAFIMSDILLNVGLSRFLPVIPGLTSLGILVSAVFFIIAIHRDKVFDIVNIAHQDIFDTIAIGILVIDDNDTVVEINHSLLSYVQLKLGDRLTIEAILPQNIRKKDEFLEIYRNQPLKRTEMELMFDGNSMPLHVNINVAPIMVSNIMVGRIITFQDRTELRRLIDETNNQNEILQIRNQSLIGIQDELFQTNQKLEQMAITDSLTGCYNRHYLTQQLEQEVMKNMNFQIPFAIFLLDIDYFKLVNDNYGHLVGDEVIRSTVEAIKLALRRADVLARYGGEEFIIYLPNTNQTQATILAERVKSAVESNNMIIPNVATSISITISMGLVSITKFTVENPQNPYLTELYESVDKALYQAKKEGRNRIVSISR